MKWLNKRGEGEVTGFEALIKIFVTVVLLLFFFYVGYKIVSALVFGTANREAMSNFNALSDNIEFMIDKTSDFDYQTMIFFMEKKHFVFGLNGRDSNLYVGQYPEKKCDGFKPCLCFYRSFGDFPGKPDTCKPFDENVVFHGYVLKRAGLESLRLEPDDLGRISPHDKELFSDYPSELQMDYEHLQLGWGQWYDLYLEKFVVNGRTHILVADGIGPTAIEQRISVLADCPLGSDNECLGQRRNSYIEGTNNNFCVFDEEKQKCSLKIDVTNCEFSKKLIDNCLCGTIFVAVNNYIDNMYCVKKGEEIFLLPFDCNSDIFKKHKCYGYCKAITDDKFCSEKEASFCDFDPCQIEPDLPGRACEVYGDAFSGKAKCRSHVPGTMSLGDPVGTIK